jgi:tetratricopeptide (TPR) repeat protein
LQAGASLRVPNAEQPAAERVQPPLPAAEVITAAPRAAKSIARSAPGDTTQSSERAEIDALLAQADAARAVGQPERAARLFDRVVKRAPNDPRAALAAFTLGHMYLDELARPRAAAVSFERANALGLPQALAEEGAALSVEAYARAHQCRSAHEAALAYFRSFPNGARRRAVEALTRSSCD